MPVHTKWFFHWRKGVVSSGACSTVTKGQIISKCFLVSSISSKKRTKEFDFTTMIPQVDLFSFVFWRKSKTPKNHFEIIWPLPVPYHHSNSKKAIPNSENKKSPGKTRTAQWWRRGGLRRPQPATALAAVYNIKARILLLFSMLSCAEKEAWILRQGTKTTSSPWE